MFRAVKPGFRSLATLKLVVNDVDELQTEKNSCGIARFPCDSMVACLLCRSLKSVCRCYACACHHAQCDRTLTETSLSIVVNFSRALDCKSLYYLRRRLANGEDIVSLGVCHAVCVSAALHVVSMPQAAAARHISLDSEGNALYSVLSSFVYVKQLSGVG